MDVTALLLVTLSAAAAGGSVLLTGGRGHVSRAPRVGRSALDRAVALVRSSPLFGRARRAEEVARVRSSCLTDLPVLLDVVTLGLSAGLSFDASLELYCARSDGPLAHSFSQAMLSWRIGIRSREEALWSLADELRVTALRRFAAVVVEALAFGSPLAEALDRQARLIRDEQRSQVEEEIERVPVKMLIPLGTLIVPAMFLAILGPLMGSVAIG